MSTESSELVPPKIRRTADGNLDVGSLADLLEFFLNYDQRVGLIRHPHVEELFQWKQQDDETHGVTTFPFENAEARFAIGSLQAVAENETEEKLAQWITDVLTALGDAKQTNEDIAAEYKLEQSNSPMKESEKLPTTTERRLYLTSSWLEALCTAEVRFLGWVYQELYGKPFQPIVSSEQ